MRKSTNAAELFSFAAGIATNRRLGAANNLLIGHGKHRQVRRPVNEHVIQHAETYSDNCTDNIHCINS